MRWKLVVLAWMPFLAGCGSEEEARVYGVDSAQIVYYSTSDNTLGAWVYRDGRRYALIVNSDGVFEVER